MNIKTTLPATEARKRFFDLVEKVGETDITFTITVRGVPRVVLMSAEEYESWLETLDIMSNEELVKGIEEGKKDLREGRYIDFDDYLAGKNLMILHDKAKNEYQVVKKKKDL